MKTILATLTLLGATAAIVFVSMPKTITKNPVQQEVTRSADSEKENNAYLKQQHDWDKRSLECSVKANYPKPLPPWVCDGGVIRNESMTQIVRDLQQAHQTVKDKFGCNPPVQDMSKAMTSTTSYDSYTLGCDNDRYSDHEIYHVKKDKTTGQFKAAKRNPRLTYDQLDWR